MTDCIRELFKILIAAAHDRDGTLADVMFEIIPNKDPPSTIIYASFSDSNVGVLISYDDPEYEQPNRPKIVLTRDKVISSEEKDQAHNRTFENTDALIAELENLAKCADRDDFGQDEAGERDVTGESGESDEQHNASAQRGWLDYITHDMWGFYNNNPLPQ